MRSLSLLILFVFLMLVHAKPHPSDNTVRLIRVKRQWGWELYRSYFPRWVRWSGNIGYRRSLLQPFVWVSDQPKQLQLRV